MVQTKNKKPAMKVVLACSTEKKWRTGLAKIRQYDFGTDAEFYFINIYQIHEYSDGILNTYTSPGPEDQQKLAQTTHKELLVFKKEIFGNSPHFQIKILFDRSPKKRMVEMLKELEADLVVAVTRGKLGLQGLFTSSFIDYLIKFSPCDVLVIRSHDLIQN